MKNINEFILERLKLNKNTKVLNDTVSYIYNQFMLTSFDVEEDQKFLNEIQEFIEENTQKYEYKQENLKWCDDAPPPLDDYDVVFDHKSFFPRMPKRLGNGEIYYEFIAGKKLIGYTSNDDYYYFYNIEK